MLRTLGLAAALSAMAATSAWAQSDVCGDAPIPPAIPSNAEVGQMTPAAAIKAKHQAFLDVTTWQKTGLKDYRDCLDSSENAVKRKLADAQATAKPDDIKVKALKGEIDGDDAAYKRSVDTEERLVNDFHALTVAVCSRPDVDKTTCPK